MNTLASKTGSNLFRKYASVLSDSRAKHETATRIYIMDSTTITLYSEILKGAGRNSENGRKKGGIKTHTIIKESIDLPVFVDYTEGIVHDHKAMERLFDLPYGSFKLAFSNIVTLARLTIGNYVNFVTLLNCPKKTWAERLRYWNSLAMAQNTVQ